MEVSGSVHRRFLRGFLGPYDLGTCRINKKVLSPGPDEDPVKPSRGTTRRVVVSPRWVWFVTGDVGSVVRGISRGCYRGCGTSWVLQDVGRGWG